MFVVDIRNHRDHRLQIEKRCVTFIGFRDQIFTDSQTRATAFTLENSSNDDGWINPRGLEDAGNQCRRCCLAM